MEAAEPRHRRDATEAPSAEAKSRLQGDHASSTTTTLDPARRSAQGGPAHPSAAALLADVLMTAGFSLGFGFRGVLAPRRTLASKD